MKITIPSQLSDVALTGQLKALAERGRETTAQLVAHLAELDSRRLYLGAGFPSLFVYCVEVLRLSEGGAYNRIEVARAARRFPPILDMLAEGTLSLTTARLLASHLSEDNHLELIASAAGKSRRQVEELVARQDPKPDVPASIRKLPAPQPTLVTAPAPPSQAGPVPPLPAASRPVVSPLSPGRYQIRFTASAGTCEKLRRAQELLRHAVPTGDTAEIIDRALTLLLQDLARKKCAATDRPGRSSGTRPGSRHIPARVRREVWQRDRGRCAFVGAGGRLCATRSFLEFHHLDPYGVGGEATVETIELRCQAHNSYEAELFYGSRRPDGQTRPGTSSPPRAMSAGGSRSVSDCEIAPP